MLKRWNMEKRFGNVLINILPRIGGHGLALGGFGRDLWLAFAF